MAASGEAPAGELERQPPRARGRRAKEQDLDEAQWEIQATPSPDNKAREMSRKARFMTPKARPDDLAFARASGSSQ